MEQLVSGLVPDVDDLRGAGFGDPQPEHAEQAHQRVVVRAGGAGGGQQRGELQWAQHRALLPLPGHLRAGDRIRPVGRYRTLDHGILVARGDGAEPPRDRRGGVAVTLQVPEIHLELAAGDPQHLAVVQAAPAEERPQILGVGGQRRLPVAARNDATASLVTSR